ncbi:MAG: MerR family transcriptional regulator [Erysipelotrichaceae bacterium]|nr:MerR family transcriptional regulator [Erysipelotrichaceae bacterium]
MSYRIGELAKMLNISSEMIRYYEKNGVIHPQRDKSNNYRIYTMMDVFTLTEAIQLKSFEINIKDIDNMKSHDYTQNLITYLSQYKDNLVNQLNYYQLLIERIDELIDRNTTTYININNYWIKNIPSYDNYFLLQSKGNTYHKIKNQEHVIQSIYNDKNIPFVDSIIEFNNDFNNWYFVSDKKYTHVLTLPNEAKESSCTSLCLCSIIDMGDIGYFNNDCIKPLQEYALKQTGKITGLLSSRGTDKEQYHRYMELRMPIQKL